MAQERPSYATFVTNFKSKLQPAWKKKKSTLTFNQFYPHNPFL